VSLVCYLEEDGGNGCWMLCTRLTLEPAEQSSGWKQRLYGEMKHGICKRQENKQKRAQSEPLRHPPYAVHVVC
jgi:hypothetical protein